MPHLFARLFRLLPALLLPVLLPDSARALVIYGGSTGHTTDPGDGLPWDHVGNTGVFLGTYATGSWIITANHVGSAGIILDGVGYGSVSGSAVRIGATDLLLYRIDVSGGAPALANLNITNLTPNVGGDVILVGDGGGVKKWGTNTVDQYASYALTEGGPTTVGLITTYDEIDGEAQGQGGDSGGGLFWQDHEDNWYLGGILSAIGTFEETTTQFTASVAIAYYHDDILAIMTAAVPEPAAWGLLSGAGALLLAFARRRPRRG
ncbi:MAG: PEP-CTERM sorting domain-containing protein [Verrucomicrobiota bacterium]